MKKLFKEFKEFISKGNVLDMAVGIIIGSAFTAIVNSLVADILNPLINSIFGGFSFASMKFTLEFPWIRALNEYMRINYDNPQFIVPPTFYIGAFISAIISFVITALALFLIIKGVNKAKNVGKKKAPEAEAAPTTKICPYCKSEIDIEATRCPHCTSQITE